MAPIYIARTLAPTDVTSPLFHLKGAIGHCPDKPSNLTFEGIPLRKEIAYDSYKSNIDAFVAATAGQKKVYCGAEGYPFIARSAIPIPEPPVKFALMKELNKDKCDAFVAKLGPGASVEKLGKTTVFTVIAPSTTLLEQLSSVSNDAFNAGPGFVTLLGLKAFRFLVGFMHEFLSTHTYPAFSSKIEEETFMHLTVAHIPPVARYTKHEVEKPVDQPLFSAAAHRPKIERVVEKEGDGDVAMEPEKMYEFEDFYNARFGVFALSLADAVYTAKPSPGVASNNYGAVTSIPELPGLAFPFFQGMLSFDEITFRRFTYNYAFRLLGENKDETMNAFKMMKRGYNSISMTEAGSALLHIVTMADLAIKTQSRLYLVMEDGEYQGAALLGGGYAVYTGSRWVVPVDAEELRKDLKAMSPHAAAVEKLREALKALQLEEAYTGSVEFEGIGGPRDLVPIFEGLKLKKVDEKLTMPLDIALRGLNFRGTGFHRISAPARVVEFLKAFFHKDEPELTVPCYIPNCRVDLSDRTFRLLSRFGPDAPSFWNAKGTEFKCIPLVKDTAPDSSGKRKRGEEDLYGYMPEALLITPKPLAVAISDWKTCVLAKKAIKMDLNERAGRHRNKGIIDEAVRKEIWECLVIGLADVPDAKKSKKSTGDVVKKVADFDDLFSSAFGL